MQISSTVDSKLRLLADQAPCFAKCRQFMFQLSAVVRSPDGYIKVMVTPIEVAISLPTDEVAPLKMMSYIASLENLAYLPPCDREISTP